jgi:hypothetical protein
VYEFTITKMPRHTAVIYSEKFEEKFKNSLTIDKDIIKDEVDM